MSSEPNGNRGGVIGTLIYLACVGLVFWLLWWLIGYLALPMPFSKIALAVLAIAGVVVLIDAIMSFAGRGFIRWK
jgi:hypothetical protein